ncbi:hypothetical protein HYT05_01785 [Candidatus Kaiserbacteria bacterium]|nr:hypothetical protein [Candidatus Kaiserbacteria bacterium]
MKEKELGVSAHEKADEMVRLCREQCRDPSFENQAMRLRQLILLLDQYDLYEKEWLNLFWQVWNYGPEEKRWVQKFLPHAHSELCLGK